MSCITSFLDLRTSIYTEMGELPEHNGKDLHY